MGRVEAIEFPLPFVPPLAHRIEFADYQDSLPLFGVTAFAEVPLGSGWHENIMELTQILGVKCNDGYSPPPSLGLKIRCGGAAIPTIEQVALFIHRCSYARIPWKATAGLHHSMRHRDATGQWAHGFINVFGAGILAYVHKLSVDQIADVLREESATAFRFTNKAFAWRDRRCTVIEICEARQWMPSFGSCSFVEPCDDLRAMGLVD